MDFIKLSQTIERYRPLTGSSSLPFVVREGDAAAVKWFVYFMDEAEDGDLIVRIPVVYRAEGNGAKEDARPDITLRISVGEYGEPELQEDEYLARLSAAYNGESDEMPDDLLEKAELSPLLAAYKAVLEYNKAQEVHG